ncbi:MAG: hypothetical protein JXA57_03935 [Armatimonadetes bacterium]|nr:hypothetical protein [Armatimonadota bacterium]
MWNEAEKIVRRRNFGGYRHAIVTYTLSWLHHLEDMRVDLDKIWHTQAVGQPVLEAIDMLACDVNEHIRDTDFNVAEWCKKEECWRLLTEKTPPPLPDMSEELIGEKRPEYKSELLSEKQNIELCVGKGADAWFTLAKWLKDHGFMQGKQRSQSFNMGRAIKSKKKEPSAVLSYACVKIWKDAEALGWVYDPDKSDSE